MIADDVGHDMTTRWWYDDGKMRMLTAMVMMLTKMKWCHDFDRTALEW
jgi:hypothetical protein